MTPEDDRRSASFASGRGGGILASDLDDARRTATEEGQTMATTATITETALAFFDACDTGKGWEAFSASGTHTGEGGPMPPTGKSTRTDYVYVMQFEDGTIKHLTKIWNAGWAMKEPRLGLNLEQPQSKNEQTRRAPQAPASTGGDRSCPRKVL
jgi:hypothetical protein